MNLLILTLTRARHGLTALALATALPLAAIAGPGAHGPNGEHLDQQPAAIGAAAAPRLEASSEAFELVARLVSGELVAFIDRYETNEPVLGATLEIEYGPLKATAAFRPETGDYVFTDTALLKALGVAGEHALVFMLTAGNDADLLEGKLAHPAPANGHDHDHHHVLDMAAWAGGGILLLVAGWALARRRRGRRLAPLVITLVALPLALLLGPASNAGPGAHGPNGEHLDAPGSGIAASGLGRLPDGSVTVPKASQRRMGIRTVLAPVTEAAVSVELPGRVIADPNASGRVQSAHGGRIEPGPKGLPFAGQRVARGDVLAYVRHHADPYAQAAQQAQLAELRAQREVAERRALRLEGLEGTVPRREIEAARTEARALAERERSIEASLAAREALVAPVAGVVARADLAAGQIVEPRDILFEVVDPARLLVEATTADIGLAAQLGTASLQGVPDARLRLAGAARALRDGVLPLTFTMAATTAGAALPLAIGQPVTVFAQSTQRIPGIVLPAQSVVRNASNEPIVWIKSGAERFIGQPVQYRPLDAATVVITQGLGADNRVVIQGAPLIAQIR